MAVGGKLFDAKLKDRNGVIADAICREIALEARMDVADYIHAEFTARGRWHDCFKTSEISKRPSV